MRNLKRESSPSESYPEKLQAKMMDLLERAVQQHQAGRFSRNTYRSVVNCFYKMREAWDMAYEGMECAALELAKEQGLSPQQLVPVAVEIVSEAEEEVQAIHYHHKQPIMLPYDYKGLVVLTHFLNCLTQGELIEELQHQ